MVHQRKQRHQTLQECSAKQWQWLKATNEIEYQLRRWEMYASACLLAGFQPAVTDNNQQTRLWEIESARPLIRPMKYAKYLEIPPEHMFLSGQTILICHENSSRFAKIRRIQQTGSGQPAVVEVTFPEQDEVMLFETGAVVAGLKATTYDLSPSGRPSEFTLFRREEDKRRKEITTGFDDFLFMRIASDEEKLVNYQVGIGYGECGFDREVQLVGGVNLSRSGQWLLGEDQLFYKEWEGILKEEPL